MKYTIKDAKDVVFKSEDFSKSVPMYRGNVVFSDEIDIYIRSLRNDCFIDKEKLDNLYNGICKTFTKNNWKYILKEAFDKYKEIRDIDCVIKFINSKYTTT